MKIVSVSAPTAGAGLGNVAPKSAVEVGNTVFVGLNPSVKSGATARAMYRFKTLIGALAELGAVVDNHC